MTNTPQVSELERKWAREKQQREAEGGQPFVPVDVETVHEPELEPAAAPLESIEAQVFGKCSLCKSYIERGESIVTADGTAYVHTVCARQQGWEVS